MHNIFYYLILRVKILPLTYSLIYLLKYSKKCSCCFFFFGVEKLQPWFWLDLPAGFWFLFVIVKLQPEITELLCEQSLVSFHSCPSLRWAEWVVWAVGKPDRDRPVSSSALARWFFQPPCPLCSVRFHYADFACSVSFYWVWLYCSMMLFWLFANVALCLARSFRCVLVLMLV